MATSTIAETKRLPIIFFVPGAWHSPWVFDGVRSILSARGFGTETSSLATVGSADSSVGLSNDAAKVRSALTKLIDNGKEVILVVHSYGGVVASNAVQGLGIEQRTGNGVQGGIVMILYLAAFAIPTKTNFLTALGGSNLPWWKISEDGFFMPIQPLDVFYADVEATLANKAVDALRKMPLRIATDISTYDPREESFEVGYIFAEEDQALPIGAQRAMFAEFPVGSFSASLTSSHSPFLSIPDTLVDVIQRAVEHVLGKRSAK
ncbi:Alpha/beta hydrolase fold-1 [Xylaria sp. FL1777]|nr:Alpha/beta hydrolase fold-1 [Xylaria sp. FL1777]